MEFCLNFEFDFRDHYNLKKAESYEREAAYYTKKGNISSADNNIEL